MTYPLTNPMTTDKALAVRSLGLRHLNASLPGELSDWTLIGFDVAPTDETLTAYPIIVEVTVQHREFTILGELEQLIEDSEAIIDWLGEIGLDMADVQVDLNADRYDQVIGEFVAYEDPHEHDFDYGDDL